MITAHGLVGRISLKDARGPTERPSVTSPEVSRPSPTSETKAATRPHVVFVDDEPMALAALGNRLRKFRGKWEISFCTSGEEALQRMTVLAPTVVIADLGMPAMDGNELLRRVQRDHPHAVRIALSGQIATDAAIAAGRRHSRSRRF